MRLIYNVVSDGSEEASASQGYFRKLDSKQSNSSLGRAGSRNRYRQTQGWRWDYAVEPASVCEYGTDGSNGKYRTHGKYRSCRYGDKHGSHGTHGSDRNNRTNWTHRRYGCRKHCYRSNRSHRSYGEHRRNGRNGSCRNNRTDRNRRDNRTNRTHREYWSCIHGHGSNRCDGNHRVDGPDRVHRTHWNDGTCWCRWFSRLSGSLFGYDNTDRIEYNRQRLDL